MPKRHDQSTKILEKRSQRGQPLRAQHNIVAGLWQHEEVGGESLALDGERRGGVDTGAGHALTIGHHHLNVASRPQLEGGPTRGVLRDEVVGGARVEEGQEGSAAQLGYAPASSH